MHLLVSIAAVGAIALADWAEAAAVTVLFALAEHWERCSTEKARAAVAAVLTLHPETATLVGAMLWIWPCLQFGGGCLGWAGCLARPGWPLHHLMLLSGQSRAQARCAALLSVPLLFLPPTQAATGERVAAEAVAPGTHVLVAPGEAVPLDGRVVAGASTLDESLLTGG